MAEPILIGTRGWDHSEWVDEFYPEELPPDWRLCYYSNHLRSVLVPAETWPTATKAHVHAWTEDTDAGFRFFLELPVSLLGPVADSSFHKRFPEFLDLIEPIAPLVSGLLLRVPQGEIFDDGSLDRILALLGVFPVCVDLVPTQRNRQRLAVLEQHDAALCWFPDREDEPRPGGRFLVALSSAPDPKGQRRILEKLARWQDQGGMCALVLDAPTGAAKHAQQARIVAELMGV